VGKELNIKVAYLCDGLQSCSDKVGCYRNGTPLSECFHCFDPEHAINGPCEHPEAHPDRFRLLDIPGDELWFWEGEIILP